MVNDLQLKFIASEFNTKMILNEVGIFCDIFIHVTLFCDELFIGTLLMIEPTSW